MKIHIFFILTLSSIILISVQSMDHSYTTCRKSAELLRNSKEKRASYNGHIPRKKGKKRLLSSKEEHQQRFVHGIDYDTMSEIETTETKQIGRSRSRSFTLMTARRSSTGQIDVTKKKRETETYYSPRLKREKSKGSIDITPEKRAVLELLKVRQNSSEEKLAKLKTFNDNFKKKQEKKDLEKQY